MWGRQVDVTAPDPAALTAPLVLETVEEHRRLRVVDEHEVEPVDQDLRVGSHALHVDVGHLGRPRRLAPLQPVVDRFGDREELLGAQEHRPRHLHAEVGEQRDLGGEQLRNAAAEGGAVHVQHPRILQWAGNLAESLDRIDACCRGVVVQLLGWDRDGGQHVPESSRSPLPGWPAAGRGATSARPGSSRARSPRARSARGGRTAWSRRPRRRRRGHAAGPSCRPSR